MKWQMVAAKQGTAIRLSFFHIPMLGVAEFILN